MRAGHHPAPETAIREDTMNRHFAGLALALTLGALPVATEAQAQSVTGAWSTPKARVRIADCGGALCANVTSLYEPNDEDGKPKTDKNNSNAGLRSRRIVGISILSGMRPAGDGVWKGSIYNPEDGKTYSASMTLQGGSLKVQGCALGGLICKTQTWSR
jgi:uncharacterized protein (DUF2147 family)